MVISTRSLNELSTNFNLFAFEVYTILQVLRLCLKAFCRCLSLPVSFFPGRLPFVLVVHFPSPPRHTGDPALAMASREVGNRSCAAQLRSIARKRGSVWEAWKRSSAGRCGQRPSVVQQRLIRGWSIGGALGCWGGFHEWQQKIEVLE